MRDCTTTGHVAKFKTVYPVPSKKEPDHIAEEQTKSSQALLYRLANDRNALHTDPDVAKAVGFDRPILHGLCTYGFTVRAVYDRYCNFDSTQIKKVQTLFMNPVYPGDTLIVKMWKEGNIIIVETSTKESKKVAMKGFVELKSEPKL